MNKTLLFILLSAAMAVGCSGCGESTGTPDSGAVDGDTDGDTDSDTDADSDADGDADADGGKDAGPDHICASDNAILKWIPNPPSGDCGPGCTQLVFEEINVITRWSASDKYVAVTTAPEAKMIIVDVENQCHAFVEHPIWAAEEKHGFRRVWIDGETISVIVSTSRYLSGKEEFLVLQPGTGEWQSFNTIEGSSSETEQTSYLAMFGSHMAYLLTEPGMTTYRQAFLFDKTTLKKTPISEVHKRLFEIRMGGDYVVWEDSTAGIFDIFAHKISTEKTWNLTNNESDQYQIRVDGHRAVWSDLRNGEGSMFYQHYENADVYLWNFETEELTRITDKKAIQHMPDIHGDRIVWQDSRDCEDPNDGYSYNCVNIWMHDLSTGKEHQITKMDGPEFDAQITGENVYFDAPDPEKGFPVVFVQKLSALGL